MLQVLLGFIVRNGGAFFILLLLIRFYMQTARIPFRYGFGQFVLKMTNFLVLPIRRIIPSLMGLDTASIFAAWLIAVFMHWLLFALRPWSYDFFAWSSMMALILLGVLEVLRSSLYLLFAVVIGLAVLSWVNPRSPLMALLVQVTEPFLRPLRRVLPTIGGVDISPLILTFLILMIQRVFLGELENGILSLLVITKLV